MVGGAMIAGLFAILADALRFRRYRPDCEPFRWTKEDARKSRARAEAATRWTWQEWCDELGTDFWTEEKEDVA